MPIREIICPLGDGSQFQRYKSDGKNFLSVELDQTFLKVNAKNLTKVTRIGEVMGRKRPPTLRKVSFKFRH